MFCFSSDYLVLKYYIYANEIKRTCNVETRKSFKEKIDFAHSIVMFKFIHFAI